MHTLQHILSFGLNTAGTLCVCVCVQACVREKSIFGIRASADARLLRKVGTSYSRTRSIVTMVTSVCSFIKTCYKLDRDFMPIEESYLCTPACIHPFAWFFCSRVFTHKTVQYIPWWSLIELLSPTNLISTHFTKITPSAIYLPFAFINMEYALINNW